MPNTAQTAPGVTGLGRDDLVIRFLNTAAWRLRTTPEERLPDAEALRVWLKANDLADPGCLDAISRAWRDDPQRARSLYETAIGLREAIYAILISRMAGHAPPDAALHRFNQLLGRAARGGEVQWRSGELVWCVRPQDDDLALLQPIIVSAADLMTGPRCGRVKQCQDDRGCGWLFVDESRAQNRRWCSMGDCGNRAKARRHYHRSRGEGRPPGRRTEESS
jgi:predicted RNA-binding Zn ribbon-like protein